MLKPALHLLKPFVPAVGKELSDPTRWTITLKQMGVKSFVQLGVFLSAHGEAEASQGAQLEDSGSVSDGSDASADAAMVQAATTIWA